jgi:hypothetical protein
MVLTKRATLLDWLICSPVVVTPFDELNIIFMGDFLFGEAAVVSQG